MKVYSILSLFTFVLSLPTEQLKNNNSIQKKGFNPYTGQYYPDFPSYPYYNYPYYGYPNVQQEIIYQSTPQRNPSILGAIFGENGVVNSVLGTNGNGGFGIF